MKRQRWLILGLLVALLATLALAPLAVYQLRSSNIAAGGAGGAVMSSAGYRLQGSLGGLVQVQASSAGYRLCSGFACDALYAVSLPLTTR